MQRAVVAIGVKKTGGLPELQAALSGATAIADWARQHQKIPASRVKLVTDAKGRVTRDRIFDAVQKISDLGFVEQLIIYFSGHGINSGFHEQWLLSNAPDDPAAAVNLRGSEMLARFCGIGHVVFISDACRTAADSIQAQSVTGGEIFPNPKARGVENPVDQYFATLVGNPAFEVKTVQDSAGLYRAAYSHVLLEALRGKVPALVETVKERRLIRPRPLKRYLAIAVPEYLDTLKLPGGQTQHPDARIESEPEAWIAEYPLTATESSPVSTAKAKRVRGARTDGANRSLTGDEPLPPPAVVAAARRPQDLASEAREAFLAQLHPAGATRKRRAARSAGREGTPSTARALLNRAVTNGVLSFGPDSFQTECGVKLRGRQLADAYARNAAIVVGDRRDVVQVNLHGDRRGASVVMQLVDGSAVVVPAFRGYITGLSFDAGGILDDVRCAPSANTTRWQESRQSAAELSELRNVIAASSSLGVFRLDDPEQGRRLLERMRAVKSLDPALAVYAAYALHDQRMRAEIADMQRHLDRDLRARIFDVAMLALTLARKPADGEPREIYPLVPMLTQGWALLASTGVKLPEQLGALRARLRPSLWTHFAPGAFDILVNTLRNKEVE